METTTTVLKTKPQPTQTLELLAGLEATISEANTLQVLKVSPAGKILELTTLDKADVKTAAWFLIGQIKAFVERAGREGA